MVSWCSHYQDAQGKEIPLCPSLHNWHKILMCYTEKRAHRYTWRKFVITESSNIWAAATNVQLMLSTCSNVLSDIKLPHLTGEFTPESNYSSGLFSFAQLTDIPLTAVGVCALELLLRVSFCCSDWFSSPLSSLAARKWGLIVFRLRGELVKYTPLSKCEEML